MRYNVSVSGPRDASTPGGQVTTWLRGSDMTDRTCSVEGCSKSSRARGLCAMHYHRVYRAEKAGIITHSPVARRPRPSRRFSSAWERYWPNVNQNTDETSDCWIWIGPHTPKGYGRFHSPAGSTAHRYAWFIENGPIPEGLELDHLCGVRCCVRPDHLEAVTHAENVRRAWASRRSEG